MNITTNVQTYKQNETSKRNPSFGFAGTEFLRFLNTNQAIGATIVDFGSMAAPRTLIDSQRGFDAFVETGVRENSGTANHVSIGAVGAMSAYALGTTINKQYNIKSHGIFANNDTIDILGRFWHENCQSDDLKDADLKKAFFDKVLDNLRCRGEAIDAKTKNLIVRELVEVSSQAELEKNRIPKETLNYISNLITSATGAEHDLKLSFKPGLEDSKSVSGLSTRAFIEDLVALARAFSEAKVLASFREGKVFANIDFIKDLKNVKMRSAVLALSISSAIGASVQPFNRWLTKKRTGHDGFVGVSNNPDVDKDSKPSNGFFMAKLAAASGMLALALGSISTKSVSDFFSQIQFKGKLPTLPHYKLVYGFTVASRFLAARDKNELREAMFKDILGFANWLILGGIVSKSIAYAANRKIPGILNDATEQASTLFGKILKSSVKTVDEVLLHDLQAKGISSVANGKAVSFKDLLNLAKNNNMTNTLKKIKWLNIAQVGGYAYSAIVLGILLPKANILMTNYFNKKQLSDSFPLESKPIDTKIIVATSAPIPAVFSEFEKQS